jgi:Tfp pilus assembly protein PilX
MTRRVPARRRLDVQRGVTILVVVVLLAVMLLGALALARMTEAGTLAAGNTTYRETSLQASELGLNAAFNRIKSLPPADENVNDGNWYWAQVQPQDSKGIPLLDFETAPQINVGAYTVSYVVERVCSVAAVTEPMRECLVKSVKVPSSAVDSDDRLDPPNSRQYRATVRVTGPLKSQTTVFIQSLMTKG